MNTRRRVLIQSHPCTCATFRPESSSVSGQSEAAQQRRSHPNTLLLGELREKLSESDCFRNTSLDARVGCVVFPFVLSVGQLTEAAFPICLVGLPAFLALPLTHSHALSL